MAFFLHDTERTNDAVSWQRYPETQLIHADKIELVTPASALATGATIVEFNNSGAVTRLGVEVWSTFWS